MTLLLLLALQGSRQVAFSDDPVILRVPVSTPTEHRATVVTFPEKALESLVSGWAEEDLSVERRGEKLFIKLLRPAEGDLHVVGSSGRLYRLAIRPGEGEYDGHLRIRLARSDRRRLPVPVELIRTMRRNRRPADGRVFRADRKIHLGISISATLMRVYEVEQYQGFVVKVRNLTARPERLDPSRFTGRDLVLLGAREMILKPEEETLLYLVFWKRP